MPRVLTASPRLDDGQRRGLSQRFDAEIPTTADRPSFLCGCHNMRSSFIGIIVVFLVFFSIIVHLRLLFVPLSFFLPAHCWTRREILAIPAFGPASSRAKASRRAYCDSDKGFKGIKFVEIEIF